MRGDRRAAGSAAPATVGPTNNGRRGSSGSDLINAPRQQCKATVRAHRSGGGGYRAAGGGAGANGIARSRGGWPPGRSPLVTLYCMSRHRPGGRSAAGSHSWQAFRCRRLQALLLGLKWWDTS